MAKPYDPDSSLREQLAQADHASTRNFMSDPSHHEEWERLKLAVKDAYLRRQDVVLGVLAPWLEAKAKEVDDYAAKCMNPAARDAYQQQAQGLRSTAWMLREPVPVTDLAPEVERLEKRLKEADDVIRLAENLLQLHPEVPLTGDVDRVNAVSRLSAGVARYHGRPRR